MMKQTKTLSFPPDHKPVVQTKSISLFYQVTHLRSQCRGSHYAN